MALIDLVISKVKDDSERLTTDDDYQPAVNAALAVYSKHNPQELVKDVSGADSHDVALPAEWADTFSRVVQVEYPTGRVPEAVLSPARYSIYRTPSSTVLRLLDHTPDADETVRVTITILRTESTIASGDTDAVASLAAADCCETLANLFVQTSDPTMHADVVNYRTKSAEFAARGKRLRNLYRDHMGIDEDGGPPAASVTAEAPATDRPRLTHRRLY